MRVVVGNVRRERSDGPVVSLVSLIFNKFYAVTYVRGSIFLWRRCDTLCTSGFVDDVMFVHKGQE